MDRRFIDSLFGTFSSILAKGLSAFVVLSTIFTGFRTEILLLSLPAAGLFVASKMFYKNTEFLNTRHIDKIRNKYINAMKEFSQTRIITPKMTKSILKYDKLLSKQREFDYIKMQIIFNKFNEIHFHDFQVDYEYLTFASPISNTFKTKTLTCHYNNFDNFLQDQSKKIQEFSKRMKCLRDIELKISYTYKDKQDNTVTQSSHSHSNFYSLEILDNFLKNAYPESFENNYQMNYNEKYKEFTDNKEEQKNHDNQKNHDDEMTK